MEEEVPGMSIMGTMVVRKVSLHTLHAMAGEISCNTSRSFSFQRSGCCNSEIKCLSGRAASAEGNCGASMVRPVRNSTPDNIVAAVFS